MTRTRRGRHADCGDASGSSQKDPRNQEVIFPYIGGEEVNTSPTHAHHRYVINFGERSEEECRRRWPELMAIVEAKVKPERMHETTAKARTAATGGSSRRTRQHFMPPSLGWSGCW